MKKLIILSCLLIFAINLKAQNQPTPKLFEIKKFNPDSAYQKVPLLQFKNYKQNSIGNDWIIRENLNDPSAIVNAMPGTLLSGKKYNMPIYNPPIIAQMPVHMPDSSIEYHILVKKEGNKTQDTDLLK